MDPDRDKILTSGELDHPKTSFSNFQAHESLYHLISFSFKSHLFVERLTRSEAESRIAKSDKMIAKFCTGSLTPLT